MNNKKEFNNENTLNLRLTVIDEAFGVSGEMVKFPAFEVEYIVDGVIRLEVVTLKTLKEVFGFDISQKDVNILLSYDRGLKIAFSKSKFGKPNPDYTLLLSNGRRIVSQSIPPQDAIRIIIERAKEGIGLARYPDSNY